MPPHQTEVVMDAWLTWHCTPCGRWVATLLSPAPELKNCPETWIQVLLHYLGWCVLRRLHNKSCLTFLCCWSCLRFTGDVQKLPLHYSLPGPHYGDCV